MSILGGEKRITSYTESDAVSMKVVAVAYGTDPFHVGQVTWCFFGIAFRPWNLRCSALINILT